jgi:hypothetical protein
MSLVLISALIPKMVRVFHRTFTFSHSVPCYPESFLVPPRKQPRGGNMVFVATSAADSARVPKPPAEEASRDLSGEQNGPQTVYPAHSRTLYSRLVRDFLPYHCGSPSDCAAVSASKQIATRPGKTSLKSLHTLTQDPSRSLHIRCAAGMRSSHRSPVASPRLRQRTGTPAYPEPRRRPPGARAVRYGRSGLPRPQRSRRELQHHNRRASAMHFRGSEL